MKLETGEVTLRSLFHAEDLLEDVADLVSGVNLSKRVLSQAVTQAQGDDTVDVLGGDLGGV